MKRTNLVLNEDVLEAAKQLLGAKTYSEAVNRALQQSIDLYHIRGLADMTGTGVWEGELSEMREDNQSYLESTQKDYKKKR